jgi:hypothetical protein
VDTLTDPLLGSVMEAGQCQQDRRTHNDSGRGFRRIETRWMTAGGAGTGRSEAGTGRGEARGASRSSSTEQKSDSLSSKLELDIAPTCSYYDDGRSAITLERRVVASVVAHGI